MANYYYSGQGSLYVGERNPTTGRPTGLIPVGNVPTLELSIEIEKFEHKESESGSRSIDLTIIQEQNATFNMVLESLTPANLALAFYGTESVVVGAAVTGEAVTLYAPLADGTPVKTPLAHVNLNATIPSVLADSAAAPMVIGTDYQIDYRNGTVWALPGWSGETLPDTGVIGYTHLGYPKLAAFTETQVERYLRFEGINTVNGDRVVLDLFRASFDPAQTLPLINEELAQLTLTGNLLRDTLNGTSGSEFFIERRAAAA